MPFWAPSGIIPYRFLQELAYAHGPAEALIYTLAVGGAVLRFGTDRLKSDVIPSAVRGENYVC